MSARIVFKTIFLLTISLRSFSQEIPRKAFTIDTTNLLFYKFCGTIIKTTKKVLLLKDSVITIETDLAYIKKLRQNCKDPAQIILLKAIINDTSEHKIDAPKISDKLADSLILNSIIASLLDQRNCWVINNEPPILKCNITKVTSTSVGSFDAGLKQKSYFVDKYMFLKAID